MAKTYKKLLFDLDNTLIDDNENRRYAMKKILDDRKEDITEEKLENFIKLDDKYWKDRAEGKIKDLYKFKNLEEKTTWVRAQRFIMYFNCSFEEAVKINEDYINYLKNNIIPIKNAKEILEYLNKKQYEIFKDIREDLVKIIEDETFSFDNTIDKKVFDLYSKIVSKEMQL